MKRKGRKQSQEWIRKRVEARKGYKPSQESLKKMSEAKLGSKNPMYGKHQTQETIQKRKLSNMGFKHSERTKVRLHELRIKYYKDHPEMIEKFKGKNNPMYGKTGTMAPMFGKHLSPEAKLKLSIGRTGKYRSDKNSFFGRHHSEETRRKMRERWKHRKFPEKDSKLELKLQAALNQNNIKFEKQAQFTGRPDIFIQPNLCIFVDGCYWHGCSCKFDQNQKGQHAQYIRTRIQHDIIVNQDLANEGFIVLRFREHEIQNNILDCIDKIKLHCNTIKMEINEHK